MAAIRRGLDKIQSSYLKVKDVSQADLSSEDVSIAVHDFVELSLAFLRTECSEVPLISKVQGKQYLGYSRKRSANVVSRPANRAMFLLALQEACNDWRSWIDGGLKDHALASVSYTVALAPCMAMELFDRQNKKGPATYFECLIGHLFAKRLRINPRKQASLEVEGKTVRLTMDFLFESVPNHGIHLPVKMSTRERVVQAWAHQRMLDQAYGVGAYKGVMVLFSETKLDSRSHEVVEICVPDQWLAYQKLLSRIERIYYFDVPGRYEALTGQFPGLIPIKRFSNFFTETAWLAAGCL